MPSNSIPLILSLDGATLKNPSILNAAGDEIINTDTDPTLTPSGEGYQFVFAGDGVSLIVDSVTPIFTVINVGDGTSILQNVSRIEMPDTNIITNNAHNPILFGVGLSIATGSIDITAGTLKITGVTVVREQQAAVADATDVTDIVAQFNLALAALRAHGLIAT